MEEALSETYNLFGNPHEGDILLDLPDPEEEDKDDFIIEPMVEENLNVPLRQINLEHEGERSASPPVLEHDDLFDSLGWVPHNDPADDEQFEEEKHDEFHPDV